MCSILTIGLSLVGIVGGVAVVAFIAMIIYAAVIA